LNPLRNYFDKHITGKGIWKWLHYLDVYHRHLQKFVGKPINILEIGVYAGGSLQMWENYFGSLCKVHGIDIQPSCLKHNSQNIQVHIGDQGSRSFWGQFKKDVPSLDILIDDGSHISEHQIITLEEMLPFLNPGGVFICEDVQSKDNKFAAHVNHLVNKLNAVNNPPTSNPWGAIKKDNDFIMSDFQKQIYSIHFYPFIIVIEKNDNSYEPLIGIRRGDDWNLD
jgi:23S rRNA U2552 (ribose-2'-O)-methylase RlmE/FtsJ